MATKPWPARGRNVIVEKLGSRQLEEIERAVHDGLIAAYARPHSAGSDGLVPCPGRKPGAVSEDPAAEDSAAN